MLAAVVCSFIVGAVFCLLVVGSIWLYTATVVSQKKKGYMPSFNQPTLPEDLREALSNDETSVVNCKWFNLIIAFLFQELRDTIKVKSFILEKVHKEFNELMFTKKEGRMIEQLTVREYDLGTSLPSFNNPVISHIKYTATGQLEEVYINIDVDYSGGLQIAVDADLVFNRVAYVAIRVVKVKGHVQFRLTTLPFTHWSCSFCDEPELILEVESTFEGRNFPQLSSFIESQMRKLVKQKYTLPAQKIRYKPFFTKPEPQSQLNELYVHDQRLSVGTLYVEVVKCSKLLHPPSATATFCTLSTSTLPWQPLLGMWRSRWAQHEFRVQVKDATATVGIGYRLVLSEGKRDKSDCVIISKVLRGSPAANAGLRLGDIIVRVNNVKVHSVSQVRKNINKTKHSSMLLTVKRPPKHISSYMLQISSPAHSTTPPPQRNTVDIEVGDIRNRRDGDTISLHGVLGEINLPTNEVRGQSSDILDDRLSVNEATVMPTLLPGVTKNVDEDDVMYRTEHSELCRDPQWKKEKFKFSISSKQHYLNVCVYDKLTNEERGELLIGHVTIPLMDIALECLVSSSGRHCQHYVLMAPELTRPTSSRAVLQVSEERRRQVKERRKERERDDRKQFVGSVFLRFKHLAKDLDSQTQQERYSGTQEEDEEEDRVDIWRHQFIVTELEGVQKCHICTKRIWALKGRVLVCERCHVQCHKRCVTSSHRVIPCRQSIDDLESHESRGFQVYEDRGRDNEEEEEERHCTLTQLTTVVPDNEDEFVQVKKEEEEEEDDVMSEGEMSWETAAEGDEADGYNDSNKSTEDEEQSSSDSGQDSVSCEEEGEETQQLLADFASHMFSHVPENERPTAIQNKVAELDDEIVRVKEFMDNIQEQLDCGHGNQEYLKIQLRQHREKLPPLQLMRRQYILILHQLNYSSSAASHELCQ